MFGFTFAPVRAVDPSDSVVKVVASIRFPQPNTPWVRPRGNPSWGSGVSIPGNRILTNSHVVLYGTDITVENRKGEKQPARIVATSRDMDLAVLALTDAGAAEHFFKATPPIVLAKELPKVKEGVTVFGFPVGGAAMSITKGEVSRINVKFYGSQGSGPEIQISAPVNPGNSGGPVVGARDELVGLVYQRLQNAQNIGYVIPNEEIQIFLDDIADGRYDGKLSESTESSYQGLENEALRKHLKLPKDVRGVMVRHSSPGFPLKQYDVITKIGDHAVDNTGLITLEGNLRVPFLSQVNKLADKNGLAPVSIIRDGKAMAGTVPGYRGNPMLIKDYEGESLPYFIHGPFVFAPARISDYDIYRQLNPRYLTDHSPLHTRQFGRPKFQGEELVVVSAPTFQHKLTTGYREAAGLVVKSVNDIEIKNLAHLVEVLRDCKDATLRIAFDQDFSDLYVFDRAEFNRSVDEILEEAGIAPGKRGSPDMMKIWGR